MTFSADQRSKFLAFLSVLAFALVVSCTHTPFPITEEVTPVTPGGNNGGGTTVTCEYKGVCFESVVLPIFVSKCASSGCHDATTHEEGLILNSYGAVTRTKNGVTTIRSSVYEKILNGEMPPRTSPQLTKSDMDSIKKWVGQGVPFTTKCNCNCDTTIFTYSGSVKATLDNSCVGCHSGSGAGGGVDLSSYAGVLASVNSGKLLPSITQSSPTTVSPMPKGGAKLSDCQIRQIEKWIAAQALNN
ncbi:MAG: hypothetical protein K1X47_10785 [Cyclobacteriaceae bacterium]|nr:hypothetical protein [Cyclobacteriaceae bacterium]